MNIWIAASDMPAPNRVMTSSRKNCNFFLIQFALFCLLQCATASITTTEPAPTSSVAANTTTNPIATVHLPLPSPQPTPTPSQHTTAMMSLAPSVTPSALPFEPYMMIVSADVIYRVDLDESDFRQLVTNNSLLRSPIAVDYDFRRNIMFWSDVETDTIVMSDLTGSNSRVLIGTGLTTVEDLRWDWIGENLYWTDYNENEIEVYSMKTGSRAQLVHTGNDSNPRALVLDPNTRYMYWTDWGNSPRIERMSMDGTQREVLHDSNLTWPNGLTIDFATQTLYWVDAKLGKIESSQTDGSHRRHISSQFLFHPFSLVFHNGVLYWSDWTINQVLYLSLTTNLVQGLIPSLKNNVNGVRIVSLDQQPHTAVNPCEVSNGNCSHFCLLSATSNSTFSCMCPEGMFLVGSSCVRNSTAGSCQRAGYSRCCTSGGCEGGGSPTCFCDISCIRNDDCCEDFTTICNVNSILSTIGGGPSSTSVLVAPSATPSRILLMSTSTPASSAGAPPVATPSRILLMSTSTPASSAGPQKATTSPVDGTNHSGRLLLLIVVGVVLFLLILIAVVMTLILLLCILQKKKHRVIESSITFGKYEQFANEPFQELEEGLSSTSFKGSLDSGVDLDSKLDSGV